MRLVLAAWICAGVVTTSPVLAEADRSARYFRVLDAESVLIDDVYVLNARIDFSLSHEAERALQSGVPIVLEIQAELLRERPWLWNKRVARLVQRFRVDYHALSQRYLLFNLNTGVQKSFRSLSSMLRVAGSLKEFPFLDRQILSEAHSYIARLRADIDIEALPTPIRLWAYSSPRWRLTSEWYQWQLQQ